MIKNSLLATVLPSWLLLFVTIHNGWAALIFLFYFLIGFYVNAVAFRSSPANERDEDWMVIPMCFFALIWPFVTVISIGEPSVWDIVAKDFRKIFPRVKFHAPISFQTRENHLDK